MDKQDLFWALVKALGVYFLANAVIALSAVPQSFAIPRGHGQVFWSSLVSAAFQGGVGYYLLAHGTRLLEMASGASESSDGESSGSRPSVRRR